MSRRFTPSGAGVRIAAFFAVVAVAAFLLAALIDHGLRNIRTSKFGALNQVLSGEVNAEIIVSGSSRALNHYDPRVIQSVTGQSVFNLGMNASKIDFQLAVLKAYLEHNKSPQVVIQNLDLFSFETTRKGEINDPGFYVPYLWDNNLYSGLRRIDPDVWKWKHLPLYGYTVADLRFTWLLGLLGNFGVDPAEDYYRGFHPRYQVWTEDFARFRSLNSEGVTYRIERAGGQYLTEVIEICQKKGVALILVYSPEYFEMQGLERNRQEIFAKFREIADRYHVPLWDYSDSSIRRDSGNFYNSQHLNAKGAAAFSADLADRLLHWQIEVAKPLGGP